MAQILKLSDEGSENCSNQQLWTFWNQIQKKKKRQGLTAEKYNIKERQLEIFEIKKIRGFFVPNNEPTIHCN